MNANSNIEYQEWALSENHRGKLTSAFFESLGSFRMYILHEIAWEKNNLSSSAMESKHFRINFYHEMFDPLRPIDSKKGIKHKKT